MSRTMTIEEMLARRLVRMYEALSTANRLLAENGQFQVQPMAPFPSFSESRKFYKRVDDMKLIAALTYKEVKQ